MTHKLLFILILFCLVPGKIFAQNSLAIVNSGNSHGSESTGTGLSMYEFRIYVTDGELSAITDDLLDRHPFGDQVSRKLYLLKTKYTYNIQTVPGNPQTKTIIRKPVIYDAVMKIEHYLKKSVRKGTISNESAAFTFNKVLDVALNAFAADSNNFEKTIGKTDDLASLIILFTNRVNLVS